jgi:hypothetical protein
MRGIVSAALRAAVAGGEVRTGALAALKQRRRGSDACGEMLRRGLSLRHPGLLTIALTTLAASDLAYRLLLRGPVRRALGLALEASPPLSAREPRG